jgi:transposase-like protein
VKTVPTLRVVSKREAPAALDELGVTDLPAEVRLALADIADAARDGLLAMSVAAGLAVMQTMFDAEITAACGPKGRHDPDRAAARHGAGKGSVVLGGRRVPVTRPRARTLDGCEVPLAAYRLFAGDDPLSRLVLERVLAGVATRRQVRVGEPVGATVASAATSTSKSAISRRFVAQTRTALAELLSRDLSSLDVKVLMVDGEHLAERCCVVALAITADGTKVPVGLWDGATENKTVVRALLADLVSRGLDATDGLLVVLDGAKALSAAVREVFGAHAVIQRCTLHKRRNVAEHLPEKEQPWVDAKLVKAFAHPDPAQGLRNARHLATLLEKGYPGAAASLREGLEEMFTVARLGIDGRLASTLVTSNPIDSMISIARTTNRNVTHWKDGEMVLRWTAAGMINAERSFRRVKGYKQMPQLVAALYRHAHPDTAAPAETVDTAA